MFDKVSKILLKVFGSRNERLIKVYSIIAQQAGAFEEQTRKLDDEVLKAKTGQFKTALKAGTRPEDILPEVFAVVREAAKRNVNMRHFDVQLVGGNVLYEGPSGGRHYRAVGDDGWPGPGAEDCARRA